MRRRRTYVERDCRKELHSSSRALQQRRTNGRRHTGETTETGACDYCNIGRSWKGRRNEKGEKIVADSLHSPLFHRERDAARQRAAATRRETDEARAESHRRSDTLSSSTAAAAAAAAAAQQKQQRRRWWRWRRRRRRRRQHGKPKVVGGGRAGVTKKADNFFWNTEKRYPYATTAAAFSFLCGRQVHF